MYFTFACPACEKKLKVRDELRGRRCRCPYCKASIAIPQEEQPPEPQREGPPAPPAGFPGIDTGGADQISVADRARGKTPSRPAPSAPAATAAGLTVNTDVNMLVSALLGVLFTGVFYLTVWPFAGSTFGKLFIREQGFHEPGWWIPPTLVFMMGWALGILALKWRKLKRQRTSMLFDLLPNDLGEINQDTLDGFVSHLRGLPSEAARAFWSTACGAAWSTSACARARPRWAPSSPRSPTSTPTPSSRATCC